MASRNRSRSGLRKDSNTFNKNTNQPLEDLSAISDGRRDTLQTTINKTGYLGDISSAATIAKDKTVNDINMKAVEDKIESTYSKSNWDSTVPCKKLYNDYDKKYQSCCIDDTTNGTLLFNNTEGRDTTINFGQKLESFKGSTLRSFLPTNSSSDEETVKVPETKRFLPRRRSKSISKKISKNDNNQLDINTSKLSNITQKRGIKVNESTTEDLVEQTYTTTYSQQTTMGLYSEFKNDYENLLDCSKVLGEVSTTNKDKSNIQAPIENKPTKSKKSDRVQPSPIPKEERTEITDISSSCLKNSYSRDKKNISSKYNRLTLAEQLERTFKNNDISTSVNNLKASNYVGDQFNHTYRNSLEDTIPNLNIKCIANSTTIDESTKGTFYDDSETQKIQTPYLSRTFVKNLGYSSIPSETEKNETVVMKHQFLLDNDCSTEMVRYCSNTKTATGINTPTIITDIGIKKSEFTSDNNIISTTNTQDIYSIDDDNETTNLKNPTRNETFTKPAEVLNKTVNVPTKGQINSTMELQETQKIETKPYIDPSIIDDFRDEMIQSVNDVCDFLSQKVKNNTAVNLVEERFMENARFLYKFFFHSCREIN